MNELPRLSTRAFVGFLANQLPRLGDKARPNWLTVFALIDRKVSLHWRLPLADGSGHTCHTHQPFGVSFGGEFLSRPHGFLGTGV